MAEDVKATRYLIYETDDQGHSLHLAGEIQDYGSEPARRHWFATQPADRQGTFAAVSENAMKLVRRRVETNPKVVMDEVLVPSTKPVSVALAASEPALIDDELFVVGDAGVISESELRGNDKMLAPVGGTAS